MWPDRVSNPGRLTYESGALPTALRGPALDIRISLSKYKVHLYSNEIHRADIITGGQLVAENNVNPGINSGSFNTGVGT